MGRMVVVSSFANLFNVWLHKRWIGGFSSLLLYSVCCVMLLSWTQEGNQPLGTVPTTAFVSHCSCECKCLYVREAKWHCGIFRKIILTSCSSWGGLGNTVSPPPRSLRTRVWKPLPWYLHLWPYVIGDVRLSQTCKNGNFLWFHPAHVILDGFLLVHALFTRAVPVCLPLLGCISSGTVLVWGAVYKWCVFLCATISNVETPPTPGLDTPLASDLDTPVDTTVSFLLFLFLSPYPPDPLLLPPSPCYYN